MIHPLEILQLLKTIFEECEVTQKYIQVMLLITKITNTI
jgi:hypothetical protein